MNQFVKSVIRGSFHRCGGLSTAIWWSRNRFRILTYHRFSSKLHPHVAENLRTQCDFLKKTFAILPLSEIAELLRTGRRVPDKALAITIDDGYRDFLEDGFPVFQSAGIPVTVYLITGFLDGNFWPWWDQVAYAATHSPRKSVQIGEHDKRRVFSLLTSSERSTTAEVLCQRLMRASPDERVNFCRRVPEMFEIEIPSCPPPEHVPLRWDEVRRLAQSGVEFGAHTDTHPALPDLEDPLQLKREIAGSKDRIEAELASPVIHFCYPYGAFDQRVADAVRQSGLHTATTVVPGLNGLDENPFELRRFSVEPEFEERYFREEVAGLHHR